jgi:hypothetical protein
MTKQSFQWPGRRPNDPAHDMLVAFLVMDIQRNLEWARELADRLVDVKSGKLPVWERLGNAYRVELTAKGALVEDLVEEDCPAQTISLDEFGLAIEAWMEGVAHKP